MFELLWMLCKLLTEECVCEHTYSRRINGGNYSVELM